MLKSLRQYASFSAQPFPAGRALRLLALLLPLYQSSLAQGLTEPLVLRLSFNLTPALGSSGASSAAPEVQAERGAVSLSPTHASEPPTEIKHVLESLISSALQDHPAIHAQEVQKQAAQANVDSAAWQFYPTPSFSIEKARASTTDTSYQGDDRVSTVRIQQPLWTGGRLTAGKNKARADMVVSATAAEDTRQQIALRVVQIYSDWLTAHLKTQANEKSLATHEQLCEQIKRRVEQGVSSDIDLTLAKGRLKAVVADISLARTQKEVALARLAQLIGHPIDDEALRASIASPRQLEADLSSSIDQALSINPMIQKAQAQVKVREAVIAERRADLSPEVYLRAERQYGNYGYRNTAPENRLFIGITSRFGAGLSVLSEIEAAKSQHRAALIDIEVQNRSVREQIQADYALALSSESRLEALKASLDMAKQIVDSYNRQFLAGRKTWIDVLNAARELAQTEIQLADIQASQVVASWRLAIYTQGLANIVGGQ